MTSPDNRMSLPQLFWKYRDIFGRYRMPILTGVLCLLVVNGVGVVIPWQIKGAVDAVQHIFAGGQVAREPALWRAFYTHLGAIAALATLVLLARIASRQFLLGSGRRIEFEMRNRLFDHLLKMPPAYYAAHPPGELMSRMTNDVDATKFLTGGGVMMGANTLFAYLLTIPMMWILNWRLALVTFLFYPIVIWVMTKISRKVRQGYADVQAVLADVSTVAQENLSGMMVIQSYARESQEAQRFSVLCDRYFGTYTKLIHERILLFMVLAALSGLSTWLVLLVGGGQVIGGQLNWGGFVAFTMYLEHLAWPTMALGWTISVFQQGAAALDRIDSVLSTESTLQAAAESKEESPAFTSAVKGDIRIQNLTFAYHNPYQPGEESASLPVLRDISLHVRPGETVALVGPVGSGKSTLLRLLPRLQDVPAGTIFLDGRDITTVALDALRKSMVLMPQASFLFSSTISQNMAFGSPEILEASTSEALLREVAETAGVHADIDALPHRYETLVGERGLMLSGGQRQRVALARTLIMEAPILILDDPFSNIDADTERQIVHALKMRRTFESRTTLLATHRFSLMPLCDRVILMEAGRIVASGTHAQLLKTQPLYRRLHRLQELRDALGPWEPEPLTQGVLAESGEEL